MQSKISCLAIIGEAYRCLGRFRKAVAFQKKALQITQRIGNKRGEARCHNNLGKSFHFLGCYDESIAHYRKALEISQEIGMRREEGISVGNLGGSYYVIGRYEESIECYEKTLKISKELKDRRRKLLTATLEVSITPLVNTANHLSVFRIKVFPFVKNLVVDKAGERT